MFFLETVRKEKSSEQKKKAAFSLRKDSECDSQQYQGG
jgi:hypothetical protein